MTKYICQKGLVSLVTPGWNGVNFVHRLLDSIIVQTYRPLQYIYVDDGSTDGTADVVKEYEEKFKKAGIDFVYVHRDNGGICEALMTGFQYVQGEYLSCPEYDDVLFPESIEQRVTYLKEHEDCAVVVADAWIVPENNLSERRQLISHKNPNRFDRNHFYQCLMSNTIFNAACYMVRMQHFDETHSDRRIIPYQYGSNQQILLPLYYHWNRGFIDCPLSLLITRPSSLSKIKPKFEEYVNRDIVYRQLLFDVLDTIDMLDDDRQFYKDRVEINVQKDFLELGQKYKKKDFANTARLYLIDRDELPVKTMSNSPIMYIKKVIQLFLK